jgi:uncharacterized protein YdaU (DUF1376 family)
VNYYPFHIGDYVAHTSHLSWEEDIAYRRMMDAYYLREGPLPLDVTAIARLIRMRESGAAIQAVLDEFFVPEDDGWHQRRCDAEIAAMKTKQAQSEERDDHERERMRRHRERRKRMFDALRAKGVVPAWDTSTKELERLCKEEPATDLQREQVETCNAPATAIPTPTPTPTPKEKNTRSALAIRPDDVTERVWSDFLAIRRAKKSPLTATALAGIEREALKAGMTLAEVLAMCCERGWQGFNAEWVADARKAAQALPWFVRAGYGDEASARAAGASPPGKSISAAAEAGLALAGMTRNRAEVIDV